MTETKILLVDALSLPLAAQVHAQAWRQSHRDFCSPKFVEMHTAERQKEYLRQKQREGCRLYLLWAPSPAGVVAVSPKGVIQDLYVLPQMQNRGLGTALLRFAAEQCGQQAFLWILENNQGARRLYLRNGFRETGRVENEGRLAQIELSLSRPFPWQKKGDAEGGGAPGEKRVKSLEKQGREREAPPCKQAGFRL